MEYKPIKDFGVIVTGKTPATDVSDFWNGEIPFITPSDYGYNDRYLQHIERKITNKAVKSQSKTLIPKDSVCITCIGSTVGKVCMTSEESITNQQINSIICNKRYDALYVFYLIKNYLSFLQMYGSGTGSGLPIISKSKFERIKFPIHPNVDIQRNISSVLDKYDTLIEVNNKRIKLFEQMAEELYKEWFVRFRFPGYETAEFVDGRLGKIPKAFQIVKMQDVFDYYVGGGWGNDDEDTEFSKAAYVIRGTDFPAIQKGDISSCPYRYHKPSNFKARKLEAEDIILEVSGGTAEQPVGRTVYVDKSIIDRFNGDVICASFCKQIRLKKDIIAPIYFYYWMQFLYQTRIIDRFQMQSTGIINFKFEYFLKKGDVMLPTQDLMNAFAQKVIPIRSEIMTLAKQNENLIKQRDLLLPRLMSGKLEV